MKNLSEFKSRKEWEEFAWSTFLKELQMANSEKPLKELLESVLSAKEKKLIINRLIAAALIKKNKTYREIGEILWLSPNTISAIKKSFLKKSFYCGYRRGVNYKTAGQKLKNKITFEDLGDASIELLEAINKGLNKILPPITYTYRQGKMRRLSSNKK